MTEPKGYGLYIKRLSAFMDSEANRNLQNRNLTHSQSHFLMELRHRPEKSAALKEMESRFKAAQSTIAGLAVRLEKKGLIESYQDPEDRRVKRVRLTADGEACCETSLQEIIASEEQLLTDLTDCERTLLLNLLERMYKTIRKGDHE